MKQFYEYIERKLGSDNRPVKQFILMIVVCSIIGTLGALLMMGWISLIHLMIAIAT